MTGAALSWEAEIRYCNHLQNVVAITYIFSLQLSAIGFCNFLHFYFTINTHGMHKLKPERIKTQNSFWLQVFIIVIALFTLTHYNYFHQSFLIR